MEQKDHVDFSGLLEGTAEQRMQAVRSLPPRMEMETDDLMALMDIRDRLAKNPSTMQVAECISHHYACSLPEEETKDQPQG